MSQLFLGIQFTIVHYLAILEISPSTPYNFDKAYTEKEKNNLPKWPLFLVFSTYVYLIQSNVMGR